MSDRAAQGKRVAALIRRMLHRIYVNSKAMHKQYGLTGPQALVLRTLLDQGSVSAAVLADTMYVTSSNLTGILDRLEAKGLLERVRSEHDRRAIFLRLTEKGAQQAETVPDPIEDQLTRGLGRLPAGEVDAMRSGLERLVELLEELPADAAGDLTAPEGSGGPTDPPEVAS
jgi:DNA-binding MarR family transcriptional regulator